MVAISNKMSSVCSFESSEEDSSEDLNVIHRFDQVSSSSLEIEDVQEAINGVKRTILETDVSSQSRKDLVHKLIRLRIKKEDLENRKHFEVRVESDKQAMTMFDAMFATFSFWVSRNVLAISSYRVTMLTPREGFCSVRSVGAHCGT